METFMGILFISVAIIVGSNYMESSEQKNARINQLETQLQTQESAHAAVIVLKEKQAAIYQGCRRLGGLCTREIRESGEQRIREGYAGTTSEWYWVGYLGMSMCIAFALGGFLAVFFTVFSFLRLNVIEPKREEVEQKQHQIDTAEARVKAANLRWNELEKRNGILKRANHVAAHPPRMKSEQPSVRTVFNITPKINGDLPLMPPQKVQEDY